jgi:hypothetical protein
MLNDSEARTLSEAAAICRELKQATRHHAVRGENDQVDAFGYGVVNQAADAAARAVRDVLVCADSWLDDEKARAALAAVE